LITEVQHNTTLYICITSTKLEC